MGLDRAKLVEGLSAISAHMENAAPRLNELDGQLGDGDLGVTMVRGSREVSALVKQGLPDDVGECLLSVARAFTKSSGSSFGTLLATGLLAAGKEARGRTVVPWSEFAGLVSTAMQAMSKRGNAQIGDKTVLDALNAVATACEGLQEPEAVLRAARHAVRAELDRLRLQPAKIGRARIFADKSIGLDDPGMVAIQTVLDGLASPCGTAP